MDRKALKILGYANYLDIIASYIRSPNTAVDSIVDTVEDLGLNISLRINIYSQEEMKVKTIYTLLNFWF